MKISIITVCKNAEDTIKATIESVVNQTYQNIEYIIIDGLSTDRTIDVINEYIGQYQILVSEPDNGIYSAMNKGISKASGDIIYFLNADDYLFDKNVITDVIDFAIKHNDFDIIYGSHEARQYGNKSIHKPVTPDKMLEALVFFSNQLLMPTTFFNRTIFSRLCYFDETYKIAADHDWCLKFFQQSNLLAYYYPRTIVSYAHGGASGNIKSLFTEVFKIEQSVDMLQEPEWLVRRLENIQQRYINAYSRSEKIKLAEDSLNIQDLVDEIIEMKDSKFWKLREIWFEIKKKYLKS